MPVARHRASAATHELRRRGEAQGLGSRHDEDDDYSEDDYGEYPSGAAASSLRPTNGKGMADTTAMSTMAPSATVVVTLPSSSPNRGYVHHGGGLSQTTEHVLIAAGSIGATIFVVMVILGLRHMRKKGLRWHDVLSLRKPPLPPRSAANMSDRTLTANDMHSGDDKGLAALTPPRPTMSRLGSSASQQPLILQRQDNRSRDLPRLQTAVAPAARSDSFLLDESPHQSPQHTRNRSNDIAPGTATSGPPPPLPLKSAGPTPALQQSNSDNAAPPTFRQFLTNRRSTVPSRPPNHFTSRFSWTNSAAPQTPRDAAHRDTALGAAVPGAGGADMPAASGPPGLTAPLGRDSFMTQRSSLPRFRTVNSWVNQQASRFEEGKLREQQERQLQQLLQHRQSEAQQQTQSQRVHLADENSSAKSGHPRGHPDASAALETDFQELAPAPLVTKGITNGERAAEAGSPSTRHAAPSGKDAASPPQQSKAQPSHARQDTASTAPIFRHHPGDEVRISVRSHVPSEVFENNMRLSVM